jgi:hypothetical protein
MKSEMSAIRDKHAVPRRSVIKAAAGDLTEMDLLANERCVAFNGSPIFDRKKRNLKRWKCMAGGTSFKEAWQCGAWPCTSLTAEGLL